MSLPCSRAFRRALRRQPILGHGFVLPSAPVFNSITYRSGSTHAPSFRDHTNTWKRGRIHFFTDNQTRKRLLQPIAFKESIPRVVASKFHTTRCIQTYPSSYPRPNSSCLLTTRQKPTHYPSRPHGNVRSCVITSPYYDPHPLLNSRRDILMLSSSEHLQPNIPSPL